MADYEREVRLRIGRNVKRLRKLRDLSQEQLAEKAGNTHRHIGQIERGEVNVTIDYLTAIAASLTVDVADLFVPASNEAGERLHTIPQRDVDTLFDALQIAARLKKAGS